MALSKADAALSELSGLGGQLPNPHLLIDEIKDGNAKRSVNADI
ncbi:MAG: hypothetical protein V4500_03160 [Pseudomonadota bacterium]